MSQKRDMGHPAFAGELPLRLWEDEPPASFPGHLRWGQLRFARLRVRAYPGPQLRGTGSTLESDWGNWNA